MILKFFFLPLLVTQLSMQQNYTYVWDQYQLSVSTPVIMEEDEDEDFWDLEDEKTDFWLEVERYSFTSEPEMDFKNRTAKSIVFEFANDTYENVSDGGTIPNVDDGYFVISNEDGSVSFILLIIDRKNKVYYELYMEEVEKIQAYCYQVINSLRFLN